MLYAITWFAVFGLLALWSLAAWTVHSITAWTISNAGALTGHAGATEGLRLPDWLAAWAPAEFALAMSSMVSAIAPAIEAVVGWAPALAGGLSLLVWVVWAIASVLLVVLGSVVTGLIAVLRRRASVPAEQARDPAGAG